MNIQTPKRLRALGYDVSEDGGGGFEIWHGRARVGRVFSCAALEAWTPPEAEDTRQPLQSNNPAVRRATRTRAKHRAAGQMELALEL